MTESNKNSFQTKTTADAGSKTRPGEGIRQIRTTNVFRVLNFELFVKPNKAVMIFGLVAITSCVAYIAYMNAQIENRQQYRAVNEDGTFSLRQKKSRWD